MATLGYVTQCCPTLTGLNRQAIHHKSISLSDIFPCAGINAAEDISQKFAHVLTLYQRKCVPILDSLLRFPALLTEDSTSRT